MIVLPPSTLAFWDIKYGTSGVTYSETNHRFTLSGASNGIRSAQGKSAGKWYVELDMVNITTGTGLAKVGVQDMNVPTTDGAPGGTANSWSYNSDTGNLQVNGGASSGYGASYATGDILSILLDADRSILEFWKNGVSQGVASTSASGTGGNILFIGAGETNIAVNLDIRIRTFRKYGIPMGYQYWL